MDELPPEAYADARDRGRLVVPLRGYFAPSSTDGAEDKLLHVNAFARLEQSIASACHGLPGTVTGRPFLLEPKRPADGRWIASVIELLDAPAPAFVGLDELTPTWWQGTVGAPRAERTLRAAGTVIGYVVQDEDSAPS